jgi:hypothetical protein
MLNGYLQPFEIRHMNLTPGQVQGLLGLSRATYRHWKDALPSLSDRNGHTACFSLGDLFAMALIRAMVEDAGVQVGALRSVSTSLFEQCNGQSWAGLERSVLILELVRVRVEFVPDSQTPQLDRIGIVVPCRAIVADLRERLLADAPAPDPEQANLRFAPTMVRGGTA